MRIVGKCNECFLVIIKEFIKLYFGSSWIATFMTRSSLIVIWLYLDK